MTPSKTKGAITGASFARASVDKTVQLHLLSPPASQWPYPRGVHHWSLHILCPRVPRRGDSRQQEDNGTICKYQIITLFLTFLTFPPLRIVVCRLQSWHAHVYCLLPSPSSSGFLPYPLSPGLAISALVCLDFAFHLLSSVISFLWPHLYPAFAHV